MTAEHWALAKLFMLSAAVIAFDAAVHDAFTSVASTPAAEPSFVLMSLHAARTSAEIELATWTNSAAAVTKAVVFASRSSAATADAAPDALDACVAVVNPSHPCAAAAASDTALHPFDIAKRPTAPAIARTGTNFEPRIRFIGKLLRLCVCDRSLESRPFDVPRTRRMQW
jgi:hypothetical protein